MAYARQLIIAAICVVVIVSIFGVWAVEGGRTAAICLLAFLPSCIVAVGWLTQPDLFNPLGGIWVSLFAGMGLRAVYMATSASDRVHALMWHLQFEDLTVGAGIAILGASAITAAYLFAGRTSLAIRDYVVAGIDQNRLLLISLVAGFIAIIATVDYFRTTGFDLASGLSSKRRVATDGDSVQSFAALGYHIWFACTIPAAFFYFWYWESLRAGNRLAIGMAILFFSMAAGFAFLSSSRSTICVLLVNSLFIAHSSGRLQMAQVLMASAGIVVVLTLMLTLRLMAQQESRSGGLSDALSLSSTVDAIVGNENFADLGRLTRIYHGVPGLMPYKFGMSYVTWILAPIPRTQWKDKPVLSQGLEITELIYGGRRSEKGIEGGGHPPGFIAEVIMNFGLMGVPVFCALYGLALRLYQNFHGRNPRSCVLFSVFILVPISFELISGEFSRTVVAVMQGLIPGVCLMTLTARVLHMDQLRISVPAAEE